jgi:acetolactate synthase-1/2/3 large subunit
VPAAPGYGSDLVVDLLRAAGVEYVAFNPGATYRGLHDSLVNYSGNRAPELILTKHEEVAVGLAHGYAKARGAPIAAEPGQSFFDILRCAMPASKKRSPSAR